MKKRFLNARTIAIASTGVVLAVVLSFFIFDTAYIRSNLFIADAAGCDAAQDLRGFWDYTTGSARVENHSSTCSYQVGIAAYKIMSNRPWPANADDQVYDSSDVKQVGPNSEARVKITVPSCKYQIDLFQGNVITNYSAQNQYFDRIIGGLGQQVLDRPSCNQSIPAPTVQAYCEGSNSKFRVNWSEAGLGSQGYNIDITPNANFNNAGWFKSVNSGTLQLTGPEGFNAFAGSNLPNFNYEQNKTYRVRVYYKSTSNTYSPEVTFTSAQCQSQPNPEPTRPACPFNAQSNRTIVNFNGEKIVSPNNMSGFDQETSSGTNLSSGRYRVSLASWDGYNGRESVSQPKEQWFVKLMNGGNEIARSSAIRDLPDNIRETLIQEQVNGDLNLSQSINNVIAYHAAYVDNSNPNSVVPICAAFDKLETPVDFTVSCAGNPTNPNINQNVNWTATVNNATGNISYSWSGTNDLSGSGSTVSKSYSSSGTKNATVNVTVNGVQKQAQCNVTVQQPVDNDFTVSCAGNPTNPTINQSVNWTSSVNGATGNITYTWSGTDGLSSNSSSVSRSYGSSGTKNASVEVTANGHTHTAQCNVNVQQQQNNNLTVSCYANPSSPYVGNQVTWYANASGGNGNYSYSWNGDELSGSGQTVYRTYNSTGNKYASVTVYSDNQSATAQCNVNVQNYNNNNATASCYATPSNPQIGQSVTWVANVNGNNYNYNNNNYSNSFNWYGDENLYGNTQTVYKAYSTPGQKQATLTVYVNGQTITQNCSVYVQGQTTYIPPQPPTYIPPQTTVTLNQVPYTGAGDTMRVAAFVLVLMGWSGFIAYMVIRRKAIKNGVTVREQLSNNVSQNIKAFKASMAKDSRYDFLRK